MSYDALRNAREVGEGIPLYRAIGDVDATIIGGETISPSTIVEAQGIPKDPLSQMLDWGGVPKTLTWLVWALLIFSVIYYFYKKRK